MAESNRLITIDGTFGEGGGQVLRTALSLSVLTGIPFRIENIRGKRRNPGLRQQHRTCVEAAATLCEARVEGNLPGSTELTFLPGGPPLPGAYAFDIGTAGSTSLVLQTVLPVLASLDTASRVTIRGGTHNPMAPPVPFLQESFLPLLARLGFQASVSLEAYGFYPKGGGCITARVSPRTVGMPLDLEDRTPVTKLGGAVLLCGLPAHIAEREKRVFCKEGGIAEAAICTDIVERGPAGNAVWVTVTRPDSTAVFTGFGERGVRAEEVARQALAAAAFHRESGYAVEEHLADQLLLYLALRRDGGFATSRLNRHATTNMEIIRHFLPVTFSVTPFGGEAARVSCQPVRPPALAAGLPFCGTESR